MNKAFTLIEILVVVTIIGLMSAIGAVSYAQFSKQSRDSRRKADIEQIRAALEMYKSNNTNNSYPANVDVSCSSASGISEGTAIYLQTNPHDPKCTNLSYAYSPVSSSGGSCDGTSVTPCVTYTIGAYLEVIPATNTCSLTGCKNGVACNYCLTPYGKL
ncbi:prepilin-type N-terminal cleavage/methylation domain-containing protein [Candidatus Roizmanbacteria bacterium]|nr:prepilin-type N-terminal cleavage/methylation domain-containing protein [Candidatus Roizmanbacteria bacterium]